MRSMHLRGHALNYGTALAPVLAFGGKAGLLFEPRNAAKLSGVTLRLCGNPKQCLDTAMRHVAGRMPNAMSGFTTPASLMPSSPIS